MHEELTGFIRGLQSDQRVGEWHEVKRKHAIVFKMLSLAGWDIMNVDEVVPEERTCNKGDFTLRIDGTAVAGISLINRGYHPGDRCSNAKNIFKVITNGITWWFYAPERQVDEYFQIVDILNQPAEVVVAAFQSLLFKGYMISNYLSEPEYEAGKNSTENESLLNDGLWKRALHLSIKDIDSSLIHAITRNAERITGRPLHNFDAEYYLKDNWEAFLTGSSQAEDVTAMQPEISTWPVFAADIINP